MNAATATIAAIDSRVQVLTWIAGANLILTAGILWRMLAQA